MLRIPEMEFIEYFNAPIEKTWTTFVNHCGWDPWFTDGMKIDLYEGGQIYFRWKRLTQGQIVEDKGIVISIIPHKIMEFWWYEYDDGYRSRVKMTFQSDAAKGTWVKIEDRVFVSNVNELDIAFGCAFGWGQMLCLAKAYIEKGVILI
ncbi:MULTISPECIES: SRPBCC domain-containing protein [Pseudothermotoga]|uniref:SRPBCC family protein n=1 Tax=Pseudothermotoga TaxID=1643951 RepID=UPI000A8F47D7|nr:MULTISPECIES: SRPBCC domain-containing protein [Pseudothermotoga]HBJ80482.1 ATPase [Pseudothermotoga sp.]HBT26265.1 ATPase [Pseudothermotoga sp.]